MCRFRVSSVLDGAAGVLTGPGAPDNVRGPGPGPLGTLDEAGASTQFLFAAGSRLKTRPHAAAG